MMLQKSPRPKKDLMTMKQSKAIASMVFQLTGSWNWIEQLNYVQMLLDDESKSLHNLTIKEASNVIAGLKDLLDE